MYSPLSPVELSAEVFEKAVTDLRLEVFEDHEIQKIQSRLNSMAIATFPADLIEKAKRDLSKLKKVRVTDRKGHSVFRWVKRRELEIDKENHEVHLKGPTEDPVKWLEPKLDDLADQYIAKQAKSDTETKRKKLDPDEARNVFRKIGYDGTNVIHFRKAEKILIGKIYEKRMAESKNKTINFMTGNGGSGKGFSTRYLDFSEYDIVYDSAFNHISSIGKVIEKAQAEGFDMSITAVYNDPVTSMKNAIARGKSQGRWFSVDYLVTSYQQNIGKIEAIRDKYPSVKITTIDNYKNGSKGEVPVDEAIENWTYSVNTQQREQLIKLVENEKGRIAKHEYANLSQGLSELKKSIGAGGD